MARGLASDDAHARGLRREAGDRRPQSHLARGHAGEAEFAGVVGERLEDGALNDDAHLLEVGAGGGVGDAALDRAAIRNLGGRTERGEKRKGECEDGAEFGGVHCEEAAGENAVGQSLGANAAGRFSCSSQENPDGVSAFDVRRTRQGSGPRASNALTP